MPSPVISSLAVLAFCLLPLPAFHLGAVDGTARAGGSAPRPPTHG
jgi:hypothetical protein